MEDALTVALWIVDFGKKIISASPIDDSSAWTHLAHALTTASLYYSSIGDLDKAYAYSQEAVKIIREKLDGTQSLDVQLELAQNICFQEEDKRVHMLTGAVSWFLKLRLHWRLYWVLKQNSSPPRSCLRFPVST